jgi:hypothetical protein
MKPALVAGFLYIWGGVVLVNVVVSSNDNIQTRVNVVVSSNDNIQTRVNVVVPSNDNT